MSNTHPWRNQPVLPRLHPYIPIGLTLCFGIGLSITASILAWRWSNNQTQLQFQKQADNLATTFQRQIDEYSYIAVSVGAFYSASEQITQTDYEDFTQHLLSRHAGILTLGWVRPVSAKERSTYEAAMMAQGFPNFYIYEQDPTGKMVRSKSYTDYYPITFSPQHQVVGFDVNSDPVGEMAIKKARDTGTLVATTEFRLPHHPQTSLAMLQAVYRKHTAHNTTRSRHQSFLGTIVGVYSLADVIETSVKGLTIDNLNFCLYDQSTSSKDRFLASYTSGKQQLEMENETVFCPQHLGYTRSINVADQKWSLLFWRSPESSGLDIPPLVIETLLGGLLLTGVLVAYLWRSHRHTVEIEAERQKSERLLLNILPEPIADRLKENHQTIADSFTDVTVLFADMVGFTQLSQRVSATELVQLLNEIFSAFDRLTEQHGLEKIKTIGDAYMVVGGLPTPRRDHAQAIANMALDMQQEVEQFSAAHKEVLKIRIGINTGPVVAGVIGTKKFIYDLWGDAVNTASRMESHGIAGAIQVTESTYAQLKDHYLFEERGSIMVKGKGEMKAYLLMGKKV